MHIRDLPEKAEKHRHSGMPSLQSDRRLGRESALMPAIKRNEAPILAAWPTSWGGLATGITTPDKRALIDSGLQIDYD